MDFKEALTAAQSGKAVRRSNWTDRGQMRLVVPDIEPQVDGPLEEFVLIKGPTLVSGVNVFETREAAEKELTKIRKAHTALWNKYRQAQAAWDDATPEEKEKIPLEERPVSPGFPATYWREVEVKSRPASRAYRLSEPYFTIRDKRGATSVYLPSTQDLLAQDWKIA